MKTTSQLEKFLLAQPGTPTWEVKTITTFPTYSGEVTEEEIVNRHGGYTSEELFKSSGFFNGFKEIGYKIERFNYEYEGEEDQGPVIVKLKYGPLTIRVELAQYA